MPLAAMSPGPTFDRVYAALKEQLATGRWLPGDHLEPAVLGDDLGASITPVRDALHRLVGERLAEAPRHDGFWVPAPTEAQLRELYGWHGDLLAWASRQRRTAWSRTARDDAFADACPLFREIARAAQNAELDRAIAGAGERLAAFRLREPDVFEDVPQELASLQLCIRDADDRRLRRELAAYHRRRQRAAPLLLAALRRGPRRGRDW